MERTPTGSRFFFGDRFVAALVQQHRVMVSPPRGWGCRVSPKLAEPKSSCGQGARMSSGLRSQRATVANKEDRTAAE